MLHRSSGDETAPFLASSALRGFILLLYGSGVWNCEEQCWSGVDGSDETKAKDHGVKKRKTGHWKRAEVRKEDSYHRFHCSLSLRSKQDSLSTGWFVWLAIFSKSWVVFFFFCFLRILIDIFLLLFYKFSNLVCLFVCANCYFLLYPVKIR